MSEQNKASGLSKVKLDEILEYLEVMNTRLKRIEKKFEDEDFLSKLGGGDGDDDGDGVPGWLKFVMAHPAASQVIQQLGDAKNVQALMEKFQAWVRSGKVIDGTKVE